MDSYLNQYSLQIISKYFNSIDDYINLVKTCREYINIIDNFNFNPIPISNLNIFKNVKTQHIYNKDDISLNVKKYVIYHEVDFNYYTYITGNKICKNIKITHENAKYFRNDNIIDLRNIDIKLLCNNCFKRYRMKSIILPNSLIKINKYCFKNCENLKEIVIPDSVTILNNYCFKNCENLSNIKLNSKLKIIGTECFGNCKKLKEIVIPNSVIKLGSTCFSNCTSLCNIKLNSKLNTLGIECFENCGNLKEIVIPNSIHEIGYKCFYDCSKLLEIEIPNSVTMLGGRCFKNCINLSKIICDMVRLNFGFESFANCKLPKSFLDKLPYYVY